MKIMTRRMKNRNILDFPFRTVWEPQNEFDSPIDQYLGENIHGKTQGKDLSCSSDSNGDLTDFNIKLSASSSSSSLSWSEEYEAEISKRVQTELEKLDRVFQGLETNPETYDLDEIALWKRYFPRVYILGVVTPTNSTENSDAGSSTDEENNIQKDVNKNVVFRRQASLSNKLQMKTFSNDTHTRDYSSLPRKSTNVEYSYHPEVSVKSSDVRHRLEYRSLPFITASPIKACQETSKKSSKSLLLPPIENSFRSISATPRQASIRNKYITSSSKKNLEVAKLKNDLFKLFNNIPLSNR
ncbi:hypothetical protein ABEB36_005773 [Hypothenemus hampei]|uniref:Uncharacterized protein n=1 Tax=Hypothenemus hampei TaxID=57062 RepID=A0ABD1EZH5_HYPHA